MQHDRRLGRTDRRQGSRRADDADRAAVAVPIDTPGDVHALTALDGAATAGGIATFVRYLVVSGGALVADMLLFLALVALAVPAVAASATSYGVGIAAHWWLSSRAVFTSGVKARGQGRTQQKVQFLASAMAGLIVTTLIVALGDAWGMDVRVAKVAAIGVSFFVTYLLRAHWVFR